MMRSYKCHQQWI